MLMDKTRRISRALLPYRIWTIILFQALLIFCSLTVAWWLRFEFTLPYQVLLFSAAPILIIIRLVPIAHFGLFHDRWRYAGVRDAVAVVKAVVAGSVAFWVILRYGLGIIEFPRSIYFLEAVLTTGSLAGVRLLSRATGASLRRDRTSYKKVMVIGAGDAAEMIIHEIMRPESGFVAVGCVDDDRSKSRTRLHGVPVLGPVDKLPALVSQHPVDEILIAVPSATTSQMCRFVDLCQRTRVSFRTVPALRDIISGQVSISQLREVNLDDLLGRAPVEIDPESVRKQIKGQVVLVTGAAGSIGSELCRQILEYCPARLVCLDQSETGIFYLQLELSKRQNGAQLLCCVADVADHARILGVFSEHRPVVVFHAAAYKHVPVMEWNPQEAVKNNIISLLDLLEIAEENECRSFVLISSDKAVNPTSVMGATKRAGELVLSCRPANSMRCVNVRFGNVLGSNGSVVRVFQEQLRNDQPLTITHPGIKRFFMTTREAVSLVLQAFALAEHGDILVLDMGEPVHIVDLAKSLIRLSGKTEDQVKIQFTGLRPGEKLYEELFYPTEQVLPTSCQKIKRARGMPVEWSNLMRQLEDLKATLILGGSGALRAKLKQIVPEYSYAEGRSTNEQVQIEPTTLQQAVSLR
jgi:FlaA1/EpsC-like NDP-sugar epimerase